MNKKLLKEKVFDILYTIKEYEVEDKFLYEIFIEDMYKNELLLKQRVSLSAIYKVLLYMIRDDFENEIVKQRTLLEILDSAPRHSFSYQRANFYLVLDAILENEPDLEQRDKNGRTPLHIACKEGLGKAIDKLLSNGADPDACDNEGDQPLMYAVNYAWRAKGTFLEPIYHLAIATKDINNIGTEKDSDTALGWAVKYGGNSASVVTVLLEQGANPNKKNNKGQTPLMIAASSDRVDLVKLLLIYGADRSIKDDDENTALDIAKEKNRQSVVEYLEL